MCRTAHIQPTVFTKLHSPAILLEAVWIKQSTGVANDNLNRGCKYTLGKLALQSSLYTMHPALCYGYIPNRAKASFSFAMDTIARKQCLEWCSPYPLGKVELCFVFSFSLFNPTGFLCPDSGMAGENSVTGAFPIIHCRSSLGKVKPADTCLSQNSPKPSQVDHFCN